jgi:hypothetical protein
MRNAYKILVKKFNRERPRGIPRHVCEEKKIVSNCGVDSHGCGKLILARGKKRVIPSWLNYQKLLVAGC